MRILSRKQLKEQKGVAYSDVHLNRLEKQMAFPKRIKLGVGTGGRIGWAESEIDQWIAARAAKREYHNG
jgi:predicted DNA-binding transcriptional regulator AlpA